MMQSDIKLSVQAGLSPNLLAEIKFNCPEKYEIVKEIGFEEYRKKADNLRARLGEVYWEIKESKMSFAGLWRHSKSEIKQSAYNMYINTMAFGQSDNLMPIKTMKRIEAILEDFESYKLSFSRQKKNDSLDLGQENKLLEVV